MEWPARYRAFKLLEEEFWYLTHVWLPLKAVSHKNAKTFAYLTHVKGANIIQKLSVAVQPSINQDDSFVDKEG